MLATVRARIAVPDNRNIVAMFVAIYQALRTNGSRDSKSTITEVQIECSMHVFQLH